MFNTEYFFDDAQQFNQKIPLKNSKYGKTIFYEHKNDYFAIKDFNKLVPFINTLQSNNVYKQLPLVINLGRIQFADKLTYIILECLCKSLVENKIKTYLSYKCKPMIHLEGLAMSPLKTLATISSIEYSNEREKYLRKFQKDISRTHFRRIISRETWEKDHSITCGLMQDVDSFLKYYNTSTDYRSAISEVITELAENALEHAESDCLIDLDVSNQYSKRVNNVSVDGIFYGINIVVLNISKTLIGDSLKQKITNIDLNDKGAQRYLKVAEAEKDHSKLYSSDYSEKDFYTIASFQHKISSRKDNITTGGTGLSKLLQSIEEKSDAYNCYVINGNSVLWFKHNYIISGNDGWIGFNKNNNFFTEKPDSECFEKSTFCFPGTAYNLNFVLKLNNNETMGD